ncbi:Maf-like protein [Aureimonas sp. AU20]|uniref:Maf-like protein n=1 Tax=Aureimonas sp. AU20 TaxID=1349819 RepID=UPI0007209280|nr:Maf-like protein [Aureimonas sp. AU20]ALN71492.1 hypothetical protein M673_02135 [Aureimonas sp. AU20]
MRKPIVLASGSVHRRELLQNAGIAFTVDPSTLDERAMEAPLTESETAPDDVAAILAEAKAIDVSARHPGALVIGADQTLSLGDERFHKPADMEGARRALLQLSGRTHVLSSAVALVVDGETVWRHVDQARITLRALSPTTIGRYLAEVGDAALTSVGSYQVERQGIQLMERIEGDFFTIIGLPVLPLLAELRRRGLVDE